LRDKIQHELLALQRCNEEATTTRLGKKKDGDDPSPKPRGPTEATRRSLREGTTRRFCGRYRSRTRRAKRPL